MENTVKEKISHLLELSQQFQQLMEDDNKVIETLNALTREQLELIKEGLSNNVVDKPINETRSLVVDYLLENGPISREKIEEIKSNINERNVRNIFQSFKQYFRLFLPILYRDKVKVRVKDELQEIANKIINSIGLNDLSDYRLVDFDGSTNLGATNSWIAIYNNKQPNQKTSLQLFINFHGKTISYGLRRNLDKVKSRDRNIENITIDKFDYNEMIFSLEKSKQNIIDDIYFKRYWKFAPGENACCWEEMKRAGIAAIGFGNHNYSLAEDVQDIKLLDPEKFESQSRAKSLDMIYKFINAGIGDIIYAFQGVNTVIGYGEIIKTAQYSESPLVSEKDYHNYLGVKWVELESHLVLDKATNNSYTFLDITNRSDIHSAIQKYISENQDVNTMKGEQNTPPNNPTSLNQILFGPPGTGKTYNTVNKAIEIANPSFKLDQDRKEIKAEFDRLMNEGQIVFTTFHQSMCYEDFIEGIKPIEPKQENQPVIYKIVDGIFKKACAIAAYNCYQLFITSKKQQVNYTFDDLYNAFIKSIKMQIDNKTPPIYKSITNRSIEVKEVSKNNSIVASSINSIAEFPAPLTKERFQKLYDKFTKIDDITSLSQIKDVVLVAPRLSEFYAVFNGLKEFEKNYKPELKEIDVIGIDIDELQKKFNEGVYNDAIVDYGKNAKKVVLIIDEINRGNVSQIFGELITLIEDNKRLGKDEALMVTLPYSKDAFGVPSNLYIIGTMNTADRSVEALDAALRRRFSFEEMRPNSKLIATEGELKKTQGVLGEIDLPSLLDTINGRLEKLLDKDHQIGHSYFISVKDLDGLKLAFQNKIIPLLQEYFFGDYGKIGLVLGKSFFVGQEELIKYKFAEFDFADANDFSDKIIFKIKTFEISKKSDDEFVAAINLLLNKNINVEK